MDKQKINLWIDGFKKSGRSFESEIAEIEGCIDNETLWMKGSTDPEAIEMHYQNIQDYREYLKWLDENK